MSALIKVALSCRFTALSRSRKYRDLVRGIVEFYGSLDLAVACGVVLFRDGVQVRCINPIAGLRRGSVYSGVLFSDLAGFNHYRDHVSRLVIYSQY